MRLFLFLNLFLIFVFNSGIEAQNKIKRELEIQKTMYDVSEYYVVNKKFSRQDATLNNIHKEGDALFFGVSKDAIQGILENQPELLMLTVPYGTEGKTFTLFMYNKKPYTKSAIVTTNTGKKYAMNKGAFYRGVVAGIDKSLVAISFFDGEMNGVISTDEGQFDVGKIDKGDVHVIYQSSTMAYNFNYKCGVIDSDEINIDDNVGLEQRGANDCVNIYFETSYSIYQNKGSVSAVQNYVNGFFNVVSTLYDNEDVNVAISEINVWTSSDPFPTSSSNAALDYYTDYRTNFNGNIAQLLAKTSNNNGGIAWLDVLCSNNYKHSYSDISMSYSNFPNYSWTVEVVTHELGHNIGSNHTHWCGWPGGAIDNCYTTEGSCSQGPPPTNGGTIMSYCHLTNYGINFNNGFGPLPGNKIRQKVSQANCLSGCAGQCPTFVLTANVQNATCNNGHNGQIILNEPTEGTAPYTYTWSNGATSKDILNLVAGTYTVSILDAAGCPGEASFTVTEPTAIEIQGNVTDATCFGNSNGLIIASANGGTPGYNYTWNTGASSAVLANVPAGTYTVTVTDANFCFKSNVFIVSQPPELFLTETISEISCNGSNNGTIVANANGGTPGYFYLWENGSNDPIRTNLGPGNYVMTLTDANNCTVNKTYSLIEPSQLVGQVTTTKTSNPSTADGTAEAVINGGSPNYSYLWSNGAVGKKITGLAVGSYSVTITDSHNCELILNFSIESTECKLKVETVKTDVSCYGAQDGVAIANITDHTGNYTYLWSNGGTSQSISNLAAGIYTVTVTDAVCNVVKSVTINAPNSILVVPTFVLPTCSNSNGSIDLEVSGGFPSYSYAWSNGSTSQNISGLSAGSYTVTITDSHQCSSSATYQLNAVDNQPPVATNSNINIYLDSEGNANLNWVIPTDLFTDNCGMALLSLDKLLFNCNNLGSNSVVAIGTDNAGNATQSIITVVVHDTIAPNLQCPKSFKHGLCQGSPSWETPTATDNCHISSITQTQGYSSGTVFPIGVTTIAYEVIDQSGNKSTCSFTITVTEGLTVKLTAKDMTCNNVPNGSATVDTVGLIKPFTILWSNGATTPTISNLNAGQYMVTVSDGNGCMSSDTFNIVNPPQIEMELVSVIQASSNQANDGAINIDVKGGTPGYTFEWSKDGKVISTDQNPSNLAPGVYTVKIIDKNGCVVIGNEITVDIVSAVNRWTKAPITIYPNPSNGIFTIKSADLEGSVFTIYNVLGKIELTSKIKQKNSIQLDMNHLNNGSYLLKIEGNHQTFMTKLVIQH